MHVNALIQWSMSAVEVERASSTGGVGVVKESVSLDVN
jgi:hypothetical protein